MNRTLDRTDVVAKLLAADSPPVPQSPERGYLQISLNQQGQIEMRGTRGYVEWLVYELIQQGWNLDMDNLRWCG